MTGKSNGRREPNRTLAKTGIPRAKAEDCIKAISAPQRRRILRTLHGVGEARSPNELAEAFGLHVGHVSYHVKVLRECGVLALTDTQPARGAVEHFYASTVVDNEQVAKLLEATKANDE
jgi:DNA-binding transcriptional ArsR family regulator